MDVSKVCVTEFEQNYLKPKCSKIKILSIIISEIALNIIDLIKEIGSIVVMPITMPIKAVLEEKARGQRYADNVALHNLHYRMFADFPKQRVLFEKADKALDRLEQTLGKDDLRIVQGRAEIHDACLEQLGREKCANLEVPQPHLVYLTPDNSSLIMGSARDIAHVLAGVIKGEFHGPRFWHAQRRMHEENAWRMKYNIRALDTK